jgi:C-terminal processing protease CtpA/Prc
MPSPGEGIEEIAWLGIDLVPEGEGVVVDEIEGITPMEAGLQAGDIIKSVNGNPIPDMYSIKEAIKKIPVKVGQGIVIEVMRPRTAQNIFINFRLKEFDIKGR